MGEGRSTKSSLYSTILSLLREKECSISDISNRGMNWETAKRSLKTLKEIGVVGEKEVKNKRVFFIKECALLKEEKDTLLGLPLSKEQRNTTKSLFKKIKEAWYKHTERPLNKTFLQKIAVKITKDNGIKNIPYGWYLFGMMAVLQCDPSQEIEPKSDTLGNEYDSKIEEAVIEVQKHKNTDSLMLHQYREEGNELYLTRLKLNNALLVHITDRTLFINHLRNLAFSLKETEDNKDIIEMADAFISIFSLLLKKLDETELENIRANILDAFKAVWECLATYNLYESLLKNEFYNKDVLFKHYSLKIQPLKEICEEYLFYLRDMIPKEKPIEDELSKFKGAFQA